MLKHLLIKNYALIEKLEMEPAPELNIITGETGAGKSIMLGAIGLLLGNRSDTKVLFNENEKCIIEATFDLTSYQLKQFFEEEEIEYDNVCFLRREISATGKSRAFINDTPVNLEQLRKLGSQLMDVHSQHETLLLGNSNFQTNILDVYASNTNLLNQYKACFKVYHQKLKDFQEIQKFASESGKEHEFNTYLLKELVEADLQISEQEKLEEELKLLENSEEIKSKLHFILHALFNSENAIITSLQLSEKYLNQLVQYSANFENLHSRLNSSLIELKDVAEE
jgi:DNA repair protein RecN (Recombination protein N)